eukprot:g3038.t1
MAKFVVPEVVDNPEGWGPISEPGHLRNVPYAPFSKNEKICKAADWTQQGHLKTHGRYQNQAPPVFNFLHNEEEDNFHLVDSKPIKPTGYRQAAAARRQLQQQRSRRDETRDGRAGSGQQGQRRQYMQPGQKHNWNYYKRDPPKQTVVYSSSIEVRPEWQVVEQMEFTTLHRLKRIPEPTAKDLVICGEVEYCDKSFDLVTPKKEKVLIKTRRVFRNVTASDDPVMRHYAAEGEGRIFATDSVLTTIMCATKSVYSWDVVITKVGDKLFFDKRDQSSLSYLTVNETAPDQVVEDKDNINGTHQLSLEATIINQNFSQQVLRKGKKYQFQRPNPFAKAGDQSELSSCAYRYRKLRLREEDALDIIVRCEIDAVQENPSARPSLVSLKALNEFSQKQGAHADWRQRLESQRGAVFATELKNNANKISKWTAAALLGDIDVMKLGYVSRLHPKDNQRHALLGMQLYKPREFAEQIGLKMDFCWAIFMKIVELCMSRNDGKYLLLKDPNRQNLRLYDIPGGSFEHS